MNEMSNLPITEILIHADTRTIRKHGLKFCIMNQNTNKYKYSFSPGTISQWNCLPKELVDRETVDAFKLCLKDLSFLHYPHLSDINHISIYTPILVSANYFFRLRFRWV